MRTSPSLTLQEPAVINNGLITKTIGQCPSPVVCILIITNRNKKIKNTNGS